MNNRTGILLLILFCLVFQPTGQTLPLVFQTLPVAAASPPLTLVDAVVCESVKDLSPQYPAVVFSIVAGKVSCFSFFDPVPKKTAIYHNWYYRNNLTTKIKLTLKPPSWSTFSTIQLRESDIGPWRVEITDQKGKVIKVLRFSVTE
ncbi:MAG: DUF2914 domain-containing protein [Desulfobacterales bacterium]|nr:DUF2914 domain-containing protein [Desulfobacterales bacterium]